MRYRVAHRRAAKRSGLTQVLGAAKSDQFPVKKSKEEETIDASIFDGDLFLLAAPVSLDMSGIFFVEARKRVRVGSKSLASLNLRLDEHRKRVESTSRKDKNALDSWTDVIHGVSALETIFSKTVRDFAVADVLLVAAAESYINAIASHVLSKADAALFDKLSPAGKWLFLPKVMKLKWSPDSAKGHLQEFSAVVARRNKVVHPKRIRAKGTANVEDFIDRLHLNAKSAQRGIAAVEGLIVSLSSSWRGSTGPYWLKETKAKHRPPCFILGEPNSSALLGRGRKKPLSGA